MASTRTQEKPAVGMAKDGRLPRVSVIVPTRNRAPYLAQLLNALSFQTYPSQQLEVIVVDNVSSDDTPAVVQAATTAAPFEIRYERNTEDLGPAASRNAGARVARGEILAFTDSDCLPTPGWVAHAVAEFGPGVGLVCGPVRAADITQEDPFFVHQIHSVEHQDGLYPTANVFYRRDVFMELGGFDESTRSYSWGRPVGGDDTEFAWRVKRRGFLSVFAPSAAVEHQASPVSAREYVLNSIAAQVLPRLVREVPEIRETCLYRRYFIHRQGASFYLFALGAVLLRFSPWAGLLMAPWIRSVWPAIAIDGWPPRRWPRALGRLALQIEASLLLSASLIYGSVKHRSPVL